MVKTLEWSSGALILLNQTALPLKVTYCTCRDYHRVCEAIKKLEVRGAPALGAAACFAMLLAFREVVRYPEDLTDAFLTAKKTIAEARPTAVNLSWGAQLMYRSSLEMLDQGLSLPQIYEHLEKLALQVYQDDIKANQKLGSWGAQVMPDHCVALTHCNAGALATCGWGTALGVIRSGFAAGKIKMVYADETRPLLQGARLTAWELMADGIPVTGITDNMAAWTMKTKGVNMIVTGADRIAGNGDSANKIGTLGVALLAQAFKIPFYIAAPSSTFDFSLASGSDIPIEERDPEEVRTLKGVQLTPPKLPVFNPAFDVTPAALITGIITEYGVLKAPYKDSIKILQEKFLKGDRFSWKV